MIFFFLFQRKSFYWLFSSMNNFPTSFPNMYYANLRPLLEVLVVLFFDSSSIRDYLAPGSDFLSGSRGGDSVPGVRTPCSFCWVVKTWPVCKNRRQNYQGVYIWIFHVNQWFWVIIVYFMCYKSLWVCVLLYSQDEKCNSLHLLCEKLWWRFLHMCSLQFCGTRWEND